VWSWDHKSQKGGSSDDADSDNDHERNNYAFADEQLPGDFVRFEMTLW
jgi:hypothetical protein